jgi:hypothetical protein
MDDRYLNGIIGCQAVVCGRRLNNLTPWHVTLMEAIDSPLVSGSGVVDAKSVLQFIKISKSSFPKEPNMTPNIIDLFWLWRMKKRKTAIIQIKILDDWMAIQMASPRLWIDESPNRRHGAGLSAPTMLSLVVKLMTKTAMKEREAWNTRLSIARWYDVSISEMEGADLKIAYENEYEFKSSLEDKQESEIIAIAKGQLGKDEFKKWHKARKENNK